MWLLGSKQRFMKRLCRPVPRDPAKVSFVVFPTNNPFQPLDYVRLLSLEVKKEDVAKDPGLVHLTSAQLICE